MHEGIRKMAIENKLKQQRKEFAKAGRQKLKNAYQKKIRPHLKKMNL